MAIRDLLPQFDTVVNGGDADREGQLLVDEILNFYHYKGKRLRIFITAKDDKLMRRAFDSITDDKSIIRYIRLVCFEHAVTGRSG